ncbi:hypothetical protein BCM20_003525 [Clostridium beijerinckii]|nr:hypothetical protein [Clostridium beijerinckii]
MGKKILFNILVKKDLKKIVCKAKLLIVDFLNVS